VSLGRKLCLFVYYVEQINNKQWMAKEIVALNGGMRNRTVEGKIRRKIREQWRQVFLLLSFRFQKMIGGTC
jgi:hypothetical protein